jgi:hypothetical protein
MTPLVRITHPAGRQSERRYVYRVVFEEFLGIPFEAVEDPRAQDVRLSVLDGAPRGLRLEDCLFATGVADWLSRESLPTTPLPNWSVSNPALWPLGNLTLPVIYGSAQTFATSSMSNDDDVFLPIDVFGSIFLMLTRYEEVALSERDEHDRFPASASLAFAGGFLDRPIVDEYVEVLWRFMVSLWPQLERPARRYELVLTHDIDWPFVAYGSSARQLGVAVTHDLVQRRDADLALRRLRSCLLRRPDEDPANTFDFIMDQSEQYGVQSEFYFVAGRTAGSLDGTYSLKDSAIQELIKKIHLRGHTVGLHTSYETFRDPIQTRREFTRLLKVAEKLGIEQELWGGRQHYLRWANPVTWRNWESAGLDYDSSVGFADHVGFRCGTGQEYPVFDLCDSQELRLRERPLIVMDGTLRGSRYMATTTDEASDWIVRLADSCRRVNGSLVILWHNSQLTRSSDKSFYRNFLEAIVP